jgi:mono/diheme cytochrome c family protein
MKKILLIFVVVLLLAFGGFFYFMTKSQPVAEIKQIDDEVLYAQIQLGSQLYATNCASCHGEQLQGNPKWNITTDEDGDNLPPPLNGTGHTWHHSPEQLFNIIKYGLKIYNEGYKGKMQGNPDLSDEDVWSILAYIKYVWPESIRQKYDSMTKH